VAGEPLGDPDVYGDDRVFVYLRDPENADPDTDAKMEALARAGHPTVTLAVHGAADLGRIFFFAEFATAVAGWVLGINPFDQPNVQEAKDNTARVLEEGAPDPPPSDLAPVMGASPPQYVAILGYVTPSDEFDAAVDELRAKVRDRTKATTTFGYGPRYLHSTGQYHKGGPPNGVFLMLYARASEDVEIPEAGYSFEHLKQAQALGDAQTLQSHGLDVVHIDLEGDAAQAARRIL
jgi:transaldolase / glucose-6-phosphate isomerase